MLEAVKKLALIVTITILFSVFAFSLTDVFMEQPEYGDFCTYEPKPMPVDARVANDCPDEQIDQDVVRECRDEGGTVRYEYNQSGCVIDARCDDCSIRYDKAREKHRLISFIITSVLGLAAILTCLHINSKNEMVEWIYSGFTLGGLASIFVGTISYFGDMSVYIRPIVLLAEMALVIWVALRVQKRLSKTSKKSGSKK
ncbi:MAG: hypothetical protein ACOC32_05280 [Nanoarchaeota archaeon]